MLEKKPVLSAKRFIGTAHLHMFLTPETPVFINRVSESFQLAEHTHEFLEINYVSEGSGFQHIEGRTIPVTKGDMFFLPVGVSHVFRPASPQPDRRHLIVYNCLFASAFIGKLNGLGPEYGGLIRLLTVPYPEQPWLHWKDRDGLFRPIMNAMYEEFVRKQPDYQLLIQTEMIRLLVYMRRCLDGPADSGSPAAADDSLEPVIRLIREQAAEPLHMGQLASMAGLSERQFRRRFIRRTGMNFTDYVHQLRMDMCCRLLVTTNDKVSEVARKTGYQDIKFFNALFRKKTGMTPVEYRSRYRQHDKTGLSQE